MRVKIEFETENELIIPLHYNHLVQAFIYQNIDKKLRDFLHNKGYIYSKRAFKLFTFSKIYGDYEIKDRNIVFKNRFYFYLSSAVTDFLIQICDNLLKRKKLRLGNNRIWTYGVMILPKPEFEENMKIKMLTPLTVYSTLYTSDQRKKTYFYSPWETEFATLIEKNLRNKFLAFNGEEIGDFKFDIKPEKVSAQSQKIVKYKNFVIKGWLGIYEISSSPEIIEFAYDTGLGAKNSQGFGMFEVIKKKKEIQTNVLNNGL